MKDFEINAHRLGIPLRTRHNEVAPSQFEVAPFFGPVNAAADQNQLIKDLMNRVADEHNLKVLFHEKPFAGLNGNGKHNNWSLITDSGINLFQPTSSARENLMFFTFFVATIKAVHDHADLLRASIATAGNDLRLGANEAPPAIFSVFIGSTLTKVLEGFVGKGNVEIGKGDNLYMKLGIDQIPEIILDNTDRNRTSPFAFTGNKFEFRAVGGDSNVSHPMMVLNTIVAQQLSDFHENVSKRIDAGEDRRLAAIDVLQGYVKSAKNILFEGDGYSEEWLKEAKKRKLTDVRDTPRALDLMVTATAKKVFGEQNILTDKELDSRHEIMLENYIKKIQIESRVMGDLALNHIIPTAISYQNKLILNAKGLKDLEVDSMEIIKTIKEISKHVENIRKLVYQMVDERKSINKLSNSRDRALRYCDNILNKYFDNIRYAVDKLEQMVDDEDWPLVKYRELLFFAISLGPIGGCNIPNQIERHFGLELKIPPVVNLILVKISSYHVKELYLPGLEDSPKASIIFRNQYNRSGYRYFSLLVDS